MLTEPQIREAGGLVEVLGATGIDDDAPFIREWCDPHRMHCRGLSRPLHRAIFALRALTEGNAANQELIGGLVAEEAVQDERLVAAGLRLEPVSYTHLTLPTILSV